MSRSKSTPFVLVILDGFGLARATLKGNAITPKTSPFIFSAIKKYSSTKLSAHGKAVGLFVDQEGNSEAGHMTIGAGRKVKEDACIITDTVKSGTFFKNAAFEQGIFHAKKYNTAVHLMGLLTNDNSAHARPEHLYALLRLLREHKQEKVFLHLFTDGRDAPPHAAVEYMRLLRKHMKGNEKIATICGRFYAMDRNRNWNRTQQAYELLIAGRGHCMAMSAEEVIAQAYNRGETDEYICPTVIEEHGKPIATIKDNDVILFFNTRSDRARQLTKSFVQKGFQRKNKGAFCRCRVPKNIRFVALTEFGTDIDGVLTAYPAPQVENTLIDVLGKETKQLYIAETEKHAHVTYFFNGGRSEIVAGERRKLFKSDRIISYAKKPQMRAEAISDYVIKNIQTGKQDFICVNYANADMVGHTGDFEATKEAVRFLDSQVKRVVKEVLKKGGTVIIVGDHGCAEEMIETETGEMRTQHTDNPVPCIIIQKGKKKRLRSGGGLADVAPTIIDLMGLEKPKEMTGRSLFKHK